MTITILLLIIAVIVTAVIVAVRKSKTVRTTAIVLIFGDNNMPAQVSSIQVNDGNALLGTVQPLQANNTDSSGVVSNVTWTTDSTSFVTLVQNADGTATFTAIKVGVTNVTVNATVTDSDGTAATFTATGIITVIPGPNDTLTASITILFQSVTPPTS